MIRIAFFSLFLMCYAQSVYAQDDQDNKAERLKLYCSLLQQDAARMISDIEFEDESAFQDESNFADEGALLKESGAPLPDGSSVDHKSSHSAARDMAFALPETMRIPVTIDMLEFAGVTPIGGAEAKGTFAQIDVLRDGKVMYNGIDISAKLESLCAENE